MFDLLGQIFAWMFNWGTDGVGNTLWGLRVLVSLLFSINTVAAGFAMVISIVEYTHYKGTDYIDAQRSWARLFFVHLLGFLTLWGWIAGIIILGIYNLGKWLKKIHLLSGIIEFFKMAFTSGKPKKAKLPKATAREV